MIGKARDGIPNNTRFAIGIRDLNRTFVGPAAVVIKKRFSNLATMSELQGSFLTPVDQIDEKPAMVDGLASRSVVEWT